MVPGMPQIAMPLSTQFPPPYDPGPASLPPTQQDRPVSDIRAVLVEVC